MQAVTNHNAIPPRFSVILPVYNERGNLVPLIREITAELESMNASFEVIAVDDRSQDGSDQLIRELAAGDPRLRGLFQQRNCGQSAAYATGFRAARGEWVITMDSDGQNHPGDIPILWQQVNPQIDAVCGIRTQRQDTRVRRWSSRVANAFRNRLTGDRITDAGCTFRLMRRDALAELPVFNGLHRFLPTLLRYQGYRVVEVPVRHRPRAWGKSNYGIGNRFWRGLLDCFAMRWWKKRVIPGRRVRHD